jgi:aspartokinase
MIATSEVRISVVIEAAKAVEALKAVHRAFGLEVAGDLNTSAVGT